MFPICTTPEAFDQQLARHRLDGVAIDAIAEIKALQPYRCGQDAGESVLAVIDNLCNVDQHRRVIMTMFRGGPAPGDFTTTEIDGQMYGSLNSTPCSTVTQNAAPFRLLMVPKALDLK